MTQQLDPKWLRLRNYTSARVAIGLAGSSLPTSSLLEFELAHARARDAVHAKLATETLASMVCEHGFSPVIVQSRASTRAEYLLRPDHGRTLDEASCYALQNQEAAELVIVLADGLSALATSSHAVPLLAELQPLLQGWHVGPVVIATGARVALGDHIGQLLHARFVVMLIGERPGLSAPDSLGIYLTLSPRVGCLDAERNCISNVRSGGLSCPVAARRLAHLLTRSRQLGFTGVALKDETDATDSLLPERL